MRPTCVTCSSDDVVDPVPGLPVFGPFAHLSNGNSAYSIVQARAGPRPPPASSRRQSRRRR